MKQTFIKYFSIIFGVIKVTVFVMLFYRFHISSDSIIKILDEPDWGYDSSEYKYVLKKNKALGNS
jgi:hypothetical protein